MQFKTGIVIVSDSCSKDASLDNTTAALQLTLEKFNQESGGDKGEFTIISKTIVPDSIPAIQAAIKQILLTDKETSLILTAGGTGFTLTDCTPEAVTPLLEKTAPGIVHLMLAKSLEKTAFAAMSRPVAGVYKNAVVITLPGSPRGARENLEAVVAVLPHALSQLGMRDSRALHAKAQRTLKDAPPAEALNLSGHSHSHSHNHNHNHSHSHNSTPSKGNNCGISFHKLAKSTTLGEAVPKRSRESPYPMIPMAQAMKSIEENTLKGEIVSLPITDKQLVGCVVAEDVYAAIPVPPFRASIVDGYAVRHSDGPGVYPVVSVSHAGSSGEFPELQAGTVARITTGAPLPPGADAVVMIEETQLVETTPDGQEEKTVEILAEGVAVEDNIREIGSDVAAGSLVMSRGSVITSAGGEVGVLTSVGVSEIRVFRKPKIGVLSTGDELLDVSSADSAGLAAGLPTGQIWDSNRPSLLAAAGALGYETVDLGIARDKANMLEETIRRAYVEHGLDYLITTGGVSMGEMDLLKPIIEQKLGGLIHFGRVAMKPGKPTTFATLHFDSEHPKTIFALPGNPASALVTFHLFVLPSLRLFAGYDLSKQGYNLPRVKVTLEQRVKLDSRPEYHRVIIHQVLCEGKLVLRASSTGMQRSSRVASLQAANGLLCLPGKVPGGPSFVESGSEVDALLIGGLYGL